MAEKRKRRSRNRLQLRSQLALFAKILDHMFQTQRLVLVICHVLMAVTL
jgi:hypothetical protein